MIKTKIIETTEKYDKDGKLVEKITREETSEDDEIWCTIPTPTIQPYYFGKPRYTINGKDIVRYSCECAVKTAENANQACNNAAESINT